MIHKFLYRFFVLVCIAVAAFGADSLVQAQTIEELQTKISAKTDEIKKLEEEIKQYQGSLAQLAVKKKTLANSIAELNLLRKKLDTDIRITQAKVDATNFKIRQIAGQISVKEDEIGARTAALKESLRGINERDTYSLIQIGLSERSFSGLWGDMQELDQFTGMVNENIDMLQGLKSGLESDKEQQEGAKKKQLSLKAELSDRKKIAEEARREQAKLLKETNNQESVYQKTLKQKIAQKDALEQEVRDYESTLKFILDPTSIPPRGTKVFSSPLSKLVITQQFGRTSASGRLYASGTHNGTDFGAHVGTPVMAMGAGTVEGVGDTDQSCPGVSFGRWVFIRYQNGLASTYGHLSLVTARPGDVVVPGTVVGYSGNTGYSTGPHLHVSVYASSGVKVETRPSRTCSGRSLTMPLAATNAYLDLMDYL